MSFDSKQLLTKTFAGGRVRTVATNLCIEGKLDLESCIDMYQLQAAALCFAEVFFNHEAIGWFVVQ